MITNERRYNNVPCLKESEVSDCFVNVPPFLWRRQWHPTPVLLPGKSHGRRSLVCCSPWGHWASDMTEQLHFHFSLSCIGEGNGSPLQCSCLENPRDGGAWWAAVYGVAQGQTRLKRLSSSSSSLSQVIKVAPNCIFYWILSSNCVFVSHIFWLIVSPTKEACSVPVWIYLSIFFYGISKSWTRLND